MPDDLNATAIPTHSFCATRNAGQVLHRHTKVDFARYGRDSEERQTKAYRQRKNNYKRSKKRESEILEQQSRRVYLQRASDKRRKGIRSQYLSVQRDGRLRAEVFGGNEDIPRPAEAVQYISRLPDTANGIAQLIQRQHTH